MEILSPAGNKEALIAALRTGADAVYFGAGKFNARRNADNFIDDELKQAIELCKIYGAKSYLTLNTIIKESELQEAFNTAKKAYLYGIDAVILQDLGLIKLLKENLPELTLHASTQMTVHTASALTFLKEMGIKRVVLSRECSKKAIKEICKKAKELNLETEVFVHGALCMSVSGQCFLSAALGGRSANRGLCAGSCRLPFKAMGGTGYDLSLKDLSLLNYIDELKEMGVTSLKIEGRMKTPEYVAAATYAFKTKLNGTLPQEMPEILKNSFSRGGFTDGYYTNNLGKNMFGIRTEEDKELSKQSEGIIHNLYRKDPQIIPISFNLIVKNNKEVTLSATSGEHTVTVLGSLPKQAQNAPLTQEKAKEQLSKLGFSVYYLENLNCEIDEGLFVGELNDLKRQAVEKLNLERIKVSRRADNDLMLEQNSPTQKHPEIVIEVENTNQLPQNLSGVLGVILHSGAKVNLKSGIEKIAKLSRFTDDDGVWQKEIEKAKENGFSALLITNVGQIPLAKSSGLKLFGGFGLNVINSYSLKVLSDFYAVTLSPEATSYELVTGAPKTAVFAYGKLPLMVTKNCPLKNGAGCKSCNHILTDRKNKSFYVKCGLGYSEILNGNTTHIGTLPNCDIVLLSFYNETSLEVENVINQFKTGRFEIGENHTKALYKNGVK